MIEARIECVCREFRIPELGLSLRKGDVVWVPEDTAKASPELRHARQVRAVDVRWEERCEVAKVPPARRSPTPPWLKRKTRTLPPPAPVDPATVTEAVRRELGTVVREVVREEVREALRTAGVGGPAVDPAAIADAVRDALVGVVPGRTEALGVPGPDGPVFIPTGIVPDGAKAAISVEAETSDAASESVEGAAAALRVARGARRKKKGG